MHMNKIVLLSVVTGFLALGCQGVASEGDWLTDIAKAKAKAKAEKRLILVNFTGSDWCPPCKMMHSEVLTKKEFLEYAKENLVLMEADFPKRTRQSAQLRRSNQALQEQYKVRGYPTFVLLDADGKEIWRHEGPHAGGPKAFVARLEEEKRKAQS
jgi:thioredoxin-related protein